MRLSVVLVTRNEAELLEDCLSRLGFEDELIILDMHSTDETVAIAERHGARVVTIDPDPFVVRVRNIGLDEAKGDWVLYLDPDEYVPPGFGDALLASLDDTDAAAFYMPFRPIGFGRTLYHGDVQDVLPRRRWFRREDLEASAQWPTKLCLFRSGAARWPDNPEHNHVEPAIDGPARTWVGPPIDHLLFRSVHQQLEKHIRYVVNTEPLTWGPLPLTAWAPFRTLYKHMIVQQWWRDGSAGLAEAMLFTMKDWIAILHEWEWRGHPENGIGRGARTVFAAAEAAQELTSRPSRLVAAVKGRARPLVARIKR